jgi:hypothetical protein
MSWWSDARRERARRRTQLRLEQSERKRLNAAGRPPDVEFGVLDGKLVALRVASDGMVSLQRERGGRWEQVPVTGVARGVRPWMVGLREPGGETRWIRLRGRAWRDRPGDVSDLRGFANNIPWGEGDDPYLTLALLASPYWLPVGAVAAVQAARTRKRLRDRIGHD